MPNSQNRKWLNIQERIGSKSKVSKLNAVETVETVEGCPRDSNGDENSEIEEGYSGTGSQAR